MKKANLILCGLFIIDLIILISLRFLAIGKNAVAVHGDHVDVGFDAFLINENLVFFFYSGVVLAVCLIVIGIVLFLKKKR